MWSREQRAKKRAALAPAAVPVDVPTVPDAGDDRLSELEWQSAQLRQAIVWAGERDPSKVASLSKERREVLAEIAKLGDGAESEGGALGEFLSGPTGLVRFPAAQDRAQA